MRFRPRVFLIFLAVGLTPLLSLALVSYWFSASIAEAALRKNQERELANFTSEISEFLSHNKNELTKLSRSKPVLEYVESAHQNTIAGSISKSSPSLQKREAVTSIGSSVPPEVAAPMAAVLNGRTHIASISIFDSNKRQLCEADLREFETYQPVDFRTGSFLATPAKPDERVWTTKQPGVLTSPVSIAPFGSYIVFTVPILSNEPSVNTLRGAIVADIHLDASFLEAAKDNKTASLTFADIFVVIDRGGRILYHTNESVKNQPVSASMPSFVPVANQMLASETGKATFFGANGDKYSAIYARLPALDVFVARASNYDAALADVRRTGAIVLVVAILAGTLVGSLLTFYWQKNARGIERVTEGVEAIAKGELDHRIDLQSRDDLRPLADNVELMTKQLREQIARDAETHQFQSFVRLSAILTHDLKNAIGALSLTVSNMERHFDNAEFRVDAMKTLRGATENLRALVARLSNPVTTLSGEHKLPRPVDLVPMLRRVISTVEPADSQSRIEIKLPESLFALVDVERIDKVVENLIINAREAINGEKGTITVEAGKTEEDKPFFSISDTGVGMSRRFIEQRLFRPFATTKKRGVGLGLYTCKEVVRANGGSIEVRSEEGVGTTFLVVLPSPPIDQGREAVSSTHRRG